PPMNPDDPNYGGYDDRPDRRRQKKNNTSTILLVVAAVLVLVGAILIGKWAFSGNNAADDKVAVPTFVGEKLDTAKNMATNSDLKLNPTEKTCENQPKGNICSQDPEPGTDVDKQSTINVVVSTGAPKVTVPSVIGDQFDDAKTRLEGDEFELVVKKKEKESTEETGSVLDQTPVFGKEVEKGTTITLTVAVEVQKSTVPDVAGKTCDEAKALMTSSNLTGNCVTDTETDDENLVDKVITTDPGIGNSVDKGSTVTIHIGKAKENQQVQVPQDIQGKKLNDVRNTLQGLGLQVQVQGSQDGNATVVTSNPQPGSTVNKGDTITLFTTDQGGGNNNGGTNFFGGTTGTVARTEA
ncbi:MAG: PASTA domain-containing protein, partial [Streptomyces sp.]|nr:PASTA domain-containing protein [Streptomyces sp.]